MLVSMFVCVEDTGYQQHTGERESRSPSLRDGAGMRGSDAFRLRPPQSANKPCRTPAYCHFITLACVGLRHIPQTLSPNQNCRTSNFRQEMPRFHAAKKTRRRPRRDEYDREYDDSPT